MSIHEQLEDLDFAVQAGDSQFAPALRLVLLEAQELAASAHLHSRESYDTALDAVKDAYLSLLEIPVKDPVGARLQARYKAHYADSHWREIAYSGTAQHTYGLIVSEGNIGKHMYFILKRLFDILAALSLIIIVAPVMVLIAIIIVIDDPGSPFFIQKRVGARRVRRAGMTVWRPVNFDFYKFRSMYLNTDDTLHRKFIEEWQKNQEADDKEQKLMDDPRITRVGKFIRRTSLDELPQLFNVLKGDMSLVGPRPVPVYEVEGYEPKHWERVASVPGITGYWQIAGRGRSTFDEQIQMDIDYIHQQSLAFDIEILLKTPKVVLRGDGAR